MAMTALIAKQMVAFEEMRKSISNFSKDSKSRKTVAYCNKKLQMVNSLYESGQNTHRQIVNLLEGKESEAMQPYFAQQLYNDFEQIYLEFYSELEELLSKLTEHSEQNRQTPRDCSDVKLPRIVLPTFNGEYQAWTSFKDLFMSLIDSKPNSTDVQKLHYLKSSLSGEPALILRPYMTTEANYSIAWSLLQQRYENKRALLNIQFKKLLNQSVAHDSACGIRSLLDTTTEAVKAIENLKIDNLWDAIVAYSTIQKLPPDTRQQWEFHSVDQNAIPSLDDVTKFLESRFRALESISVDKSTVRKVSEGKGMQSLHATPIQQCPLCTSEHSIGQCPQFMGKDHQNKVDFVKKQGLCFNCLKKGHRIANCPSKRTCTRCQRRHHTSLHRIQPPTTIENACPINVNAVPFQPTTSTSTTNVLSTLADKEVMLATALVRLENSHGEGCVFRALLDQGSQASFVTDHVCQTLDLQYKPANVNILGIGSSGGLRAKGQTELSIVCPQNTSKLRVHAYILHKVANQLPTYSCSEINNSFDNLKLADPTYKQPGKIDILLGAEVYAQILLNGIIKSSGLIAQNTRLGWIVSGEVRSSYCKEVSSFSGHVQEDDNISQQLQKFWEVETVSPQKIQSTEDELCEIFYMRNTTRGSDGRYTTRLPFKTTESRNLLGASKEQAMASFLSLERRLERNPALKTEYAKCIHDYLALGYMRAINDHYRGNYLPHHAVCKESTTTKVRVVFDASRKTTSGISLNDTLMTGPTLQNDMTNIILNWMFYMFACAADVEKMYLQIGMHPEDAELQRIIWRDSPNGKFNEFALTTVIFGTTCAPYLAIRTLNKLAEDEKDNFPLAFETIRNEFYVDDLLSGGHTREEALKKMNETSTLLQSAGFRLRKWIANDDKLLESVSVDDRGMQPSLDLNFDKGVKTLGLVWHPQSDEFSYKFNMNATGITNTKRKLLSDIARLFDPVGWIAPIIVIAKLLMKSLWLLGKDWDELLPNEIATQWRSFKIELEALQTVRIPRWVGNCKCWRECDHLELHGFCDASNDAYAAAMYIVCRNGQPQSKLIMSKTKVAPVKELSTPKLELSGAQLLAKTIRKVKEALKIVNMRTYLWSDSTTVIAWLKSEPSRWNVFVANRVAHIHELVGNTTWYYVPSKQNPADVASRGLSPRLLETNQLWWKGPTWLTGPKENWPSIPPNSVESCNEELRKKPVITILALIPEDEEKEKLLMKYSSLSRLLRVTAYCLRFIALVKHKRKFELFLTPQELEHALHFWIKYIQQRAFSEDIDNLRNQRKLSNKSKILKLNPLLSHDDGILRVGGRLQNAELSFDNTHPIILPKQGPFTTLLINKYHLLTLHGGIQLTLNTIRSKYWIIDARRGISQFIHRCIICHKQKAKTCSQLMGNLPRPRVTPSRPFTNTGIDYCGPIEIRTGKGRGFKTTKGYVAVFICLAIKAIHLELVSDLSTQAFLAAFRRFVGRRGFCRNIYSDCGTNFIGANTELQQIAKRNRNSAESVSNDGISWHFNPPASPHFGGLWEAGVKSVKYHLRRMAGNACFTYEELATILVRIEACLNSRPLCPLTDDPSDLNVLTPGHFLIGDALIAAPEDELLDEKLSRLDRWQLVQRVSQTFWKRWTSEYLTRLQQRPKWTTSSSNLRPGDLVLIKDEKLPSYRWPLGRIEECHKGEDGLVRVVTVRTKTSTFKRPIAKLSPLPITQLE